MCNSQRDSCTSEHAPTKSCSRGFDTQAQDFLESKKQREDTQEGNEKGKGLSNSRRTLKKPQAVVTKSAAALSSSASPTPSTFVCPNTRHDGLTISQVNFSEEINEQSPPPRPLRFLVRTRLQDLLS
jgi:hypothetical protein